ncbi:MAG: immunity protein Imm33 domain-containing protein [Thermoguttaceae bacterium]
MATFLGLEDVEKTAKENPEKFFLPSEAERKSQKTGASVRLHFLLKDPADDEPRAERMWVTITQEHGLLKPYRGLLENAPVYITDLKLGDAVTFKPCHIAQTIIKRGDPRWIDSASLKALVSKMCFERNEIVRFLYREKADREDDSGWRMFTGHETQEYTDDPKNIRIVEVGFMLDRDASLLEPLKEGIGGVFERGNKTEPWHRVTDWTPEE